MVRPSQAALRHCLEGECNECQEIGIISLKLCLLIGVMIIILLMEDPNKPEWEKEFQ
jgi:hypothetical protein